MGIGIIKDGATVQTPALIRFFMLSSTEYSVLSSNPLIITLCLGLITDLYINCLRSLDLYTYIQYIYIIPKK